MIVVPGGAVQPRAGVHRRALPRLAAALAASALILALAPAPASAAVSNASLNNSKILQFMNAERAARGLSPLSRDPRLDSLAQSWAEKMAAGRTMYHPGTPQAMASAGYRSGAQNLAWHDATLSASWAHNFWMNSAPHRKNILDPAFTHTGIAIACNPSGGRYPYVFATVEFGGSSAPLSSVPSASPHVAGGETVAAAGCDGSAQPPPPPPPPPQPAPAPPPPPAPVAPPPVAAKAARSGTAASPSAAPNKASSASPSAKPSSSRTASSSGKPSLSGNASTSAAPVPTRSAEPQLPVAAAGSSGPAPVPPDAPAGDRIQPDISTVAAAGAEPSGDSGGLVALVAGLSGILLMIRMASRHRRPPPKHAISRR